MGPLRKKERRFIHTGSPYWLVPFFSLPCFFLLQPPPDRPPATVEPTPVVQIVDGDTLTIQHNGRNEKIRLIGIDAPESRINNKTKKDAARGNGDMETITKMGKEATLFVKKIVKPGDPVTIEFDKQTRDKYGRLLGYVYLANGKMLNEEIVKAGYANLLTYPPNVKYQDRFLKAYREARENSRGLWGKY